MFSDILNYKIQERKKMEIKKGTPVIFKRGSRWYKGRFGGKRDFAYSAERVKSLSDVKKKCFVTLGFLLKKNVSDEKENRILNSYKVDRLYIKFKKPVKVKKAKKAKTVKKMILEGKLTAKKIEKYWWYNLNKNFLKCLKKCKQSSFDMIFCPSYQKEM